MRSELDPTGDGGMVPADQRLRTRRLLLAPARPDDLAELHALWSQVDVRRAIWRNGPVREVQSRALIEWSLQRFAASGFGIWSVRWQGTPEVVAVVVASPTPAGGEVDLVFGVDRDHRFHGVATESVAAVVSYLTAVLGTALVRAQLEAHNAGAAAVVRRAGLALEQISHTPTGDVLRFARLAPTAPRPAWCVA
jgi:RimJ/RimL family protein N-acetyltransferase